MRRLLVTVALFAGASVLLLSIGGCPPIAIPTGGTDGTGAAPTIETSTLPVTKTSFAVWWEASVEVGDDLIVFGTGPLTGVSYIVPSQSPTTPTAIPGAYRSSGFAVAGKKVLLFDTTGQLSVFDTTTGITTAIALTEIRLISFATHDDEDILSPVIVDGNLAVTRNDPSAVGNALKVVDVSGPTPTITALRNLRDNLPITARQVAIDASDQRAITFAADHFFVYDLTQPDANPQEIDLSAGEGIKGPFAYDNGYIIYVVQRSSLENIHVVNTATGVDTVLTKNPGNRDFRLALRDGRLAYFLSRAPHDMYSDAPTSATNVYRTAIGQLPALSLTEGGVAGANPNNISLPWWGYGNDAAITPDGSRVFISGDENINVLVEFLQVSTGGGAFQVFADGSGHLNASDVVANAKLVAFKIGADEQTRLGYIVLP